MEATLLAALAAGAAVINSGLVIWNFLQSPSRKNGEAIEALEVKVDALTQRVGTAEATLKSLPTKDSLHELQISMEHINTEVKVMGETLKAVRETSNLMRDWLLEKGVK